MPDATFYPGFKDVDDAAPDREASRKADFRACPILADYIATMLQDLQYQEADEASSEDREERDTGTIYTLNDETYSKCKRDCEAFYTANLESIEAAGDLVPGEDGLQYSRGTYMTPERIGSTYYMLRVGHGVAFTDDGDAPCLVALNEATRANRGVEFYIGDDGEPYQMG